MPSTLASRRWRNPLYQPVSPLLRGRERGLEGKPSTMEGKSQRLQDQEASSQPQGPRDSSTTCPHSICLSSRELLGSWLGNQGECCRARRQGLTKGLPSHPNMFLMCHSHWTSLRYTGKCMYPFHSYPASTVCAPWARHKPTSPCGDSGGGGGGE